MAGGAKVNVSPWGTSQRKYASEQKETGDAGPGELETEPYHEPVRPTLELIQEVDRVRERLRTSGDRWVIDPSTKKYRRWDFVTFSVSTRRPTFDSEARRAKTSRGGLSRRRWCSRRS